MRSKRHSTGWSQRLSFCTVECPESSERRWSLTWMHYRPTRRAFFFRSGSWLARVSITRPSTRWCWPCLCPGRAHYSSTLDACTGSTPAKLTCGSSILWTLVTRRCCGCGTSGSAATVRWGTGSALMTLPRDGEFSKCFLDFRQNPQQPAPMLISSGGQSARGQPSATNNTRPTALGWAFSFPGLAKPTSAAPFTTRRARALVVKHWPGHASVFRMHGAKVANRSFNDLGAPLPSAHAQPID